MDIDLNQLPIPDWGLTCPHCDYLLRGLPEHRCPECGHTLSMAKIVHTWTRVREPRLTGGELPFPDYGLNCVMCHAALAGATAFACPTCGVAFDPQSWRPIGDMFVAQEWMTAGLNMMAVERVLLDEYIPHVARESGKSVGELYGFAAVSVTERRVHLAISCEFFFDFWAAILEERKHWDAIREARNGPPWQCLACGEECPGNFAVCWKCGRGRE